MKKLGAFCFLLAAQHSSAMQKLSIKDKWIFHLKNALEDLPQINT